MGRKSVEIKPEWAENLNTILDEQGINQLQLSKLIHISQQTISKIMNGKASLTEDNARLIIKHFPQYRLEWLMGYDQHKTLTELYISIVSEAQHEGDTLMLGFQAFAHLNGFEIESDFPAHLEISKNEDATLEIDDVAFEKLIRPKYKITRDGKAAFISAEEMNVLQNEICEYVEFKLERVLRRAENG